MAYLRLGVAAMLALMVVPSEQVRRAPDLMGSYCGSRPPRSQCCANRSDGCSVPIKGTLCYCDQFCSHGINEDCCPDYWEICLGEQPKPLTSCYFEGKQYNGGESFVSNCNKWWVYLSTKIMPPVSYFLWKQVTHYTWKNAVTVSSNEMLFFHSTSFGDEHRKN